MRPRSAISPRSWRPRCRRSSHKLLATSVTDVSGFAAVGAPTRTGGPGHSMTCFESKAQDP